MKKSLLALLLCLITAVAAGAITVDHVPNVHVADRSRYVSNPSGVLSSEAVSRLDNAIARVWRGSSAELVVVAVDEVDPSMTPDEFATALFEKWGVGKGDNDNGVLVLVARDDRKVVIRTGYGAEGVLPDILAGRIIRSQILPAFREGDYDKGVEDGVSAISELLLNPENAKELASKYDNDSQAQEDDFNGDALFGIYLTIAGWVALCMLGYVVYIIVSTRRIDDVDRWRKLNEVNPWALMAGCFTLGMGLVAWLILIWKMHSLRRHKRNCPHCGHRMELIDEEHDNDYLTPSQDLEEKLNSVDYDVWRCPKCAQTDIIPYINRTSPYRECPRCHTRALSVVDRRILRQPTTRTEGEGVDISRCKACGYEENKRFRIARKPDPAKAAAAGAVAGSVFGRGGGGGFGGGGFSGGSFGGGHTGGGGASGSW